VIELLVGLAIAVIVCYGFVRLAAHNGNRRWTDAEYEAERRGGTALGNALLATQAIFSPGAQHVLEQRNDDAAEDEDQGAPPDPGMRRS
jgi:hypothetical protein